MIRKLTPAALAASVLCLGAAPALAQQVRSPAMTISKPGDTSAGPATQTLEGAEAVRAAIAAGRNPAGRAEAAPARQGGNGAPVVLTQKPPVAHSAASHRVKPRRKR